MGDILSSNEDIGIYKPFNRLFIYIFIKTSLYFFFIYYFVFVTKKWNDINMWYIYPWICCLDWVGILDENTELNLRFLGEYVKMKQGTPAYFTDINNEESAMFTLKIQKIIFNLLNVFFLYKFAICVR